MGRFILCTGRTAVKPYIFPISETKVYSIDEIYTNIWEEESFAAENIIAVHIRHIREKIEINPSERKYLKVVWAHGYKLEKGDKK